MRGKLIKPVVLKDIVRCHEVLVCCARTGSGSSVLGRPRAVRARQDGFTLTEVIIASTLLVLAMVPILRALTSAISSSTIIEQRTQSLVLAQSKLDDIRARSIYNYDEDFTQSGVSLDGAYLCDVADSAQTSDLRRLSVSVGYDSNGNNSLEAGEIGVTLTTLLARRW